MFLFHGNPTKESLHVEALFSCQRLTRDKSTSLISSLPGWWHAFILSSPLLFLMTQKRNNNHKVESAVCVKLQGQKIQGV